MHGALSSSGRGPSVAGRMWHVTLTVRGVAVPPDEVRAGLERLQHERPFLLAGRYSADCAEVRYWEEAERLEDAAALALRLWGEHRRSAGLPPWSVVGLEVIDRRRSACAVPAASSTCGSPRLAPSAPSWRRLRLLAAGRRLPFQDE